MLSALLLVSGKLTAVCAFCMCVCAACPVWVVSQVFSRDSSTGLLRFSSTLLLSFDDIPRNFQVGQARCHK